MFRGKNFSLAPCKPSTFTTTKFTMTFHRSYRNIKVMDVILVNVTPRRFVANLVSFWRNVFFIHLNFCALKINYNFFLKFSKCILGHMS